MVLHYVKKYLAVETARRLGGTLITSFVDGRPEYKVIL